ncbi:antibiotic transporter [Marmoricola sp. Leaf446]|uniref:MFS transporter n=1 Tax=Marmoricola sp. Leaf446 TaxID=1736379 RepID=UPI0006FF6146|nr:MFS transporter [Marmoricola sp. Leaf446]KQT91061.1 antibiotic transporter [Marmoricola sp. Leaf446]
MPVVAGLLERVLPRRWGTSFRWLVGAGWASNLGDGIVIAAGPLLVASETRDPVLVALAWTLGFAPTMLFGLLAGVVADRVDRRLLITVANLCRVVLVGSLSALVLTGDVSIGLVLVALFLVGTAETFADTTSATLLPMLVERRDLGVANARLLAGVVTLNQLVGPPLGALLFGLGRATPFLAQVVCVLAALVMVRRLRLPRHGRAGTALARPSIRADVAEGLRWVLHHAAVRTLVLTIVTFNVTFGAAWSVLVLYSLERLDMGEVGFGLLTSALAAGGIVGTLSYGWLEQHVSLGNIMRVGLVVETLTHLGLAITTVPAVALAIFFVFGVHAFVWGTTSTAVRQRAVPMAVQGRVQSVYMLGVNGGIVVGSLLGGVIAARWGVTAPFWFAFVGSAVFLVLIWRQLVHITHTDTQEPVRP